MAIVLKKMTIYDKFWHLKKTFSTKKIIVHFAIAIKPCITFPFPQPAFKATHITIADRLITHSLLVIVRINDGLFI